MSPPSAAAAAAAETAIAQKQPAQKPTTPHPPPPNHAALAKMILPHVPKLLYKSATHLLNLSRTAQYWDLRTTLTVEFLRSYLAPKPSYALPTVEEVQRSTCRPTATPAGVLKLDILYGPGDVELDGLEELEALVHSQLPGDTPRVGMAESLTAEWLQHAGGGGGGGGGKEEGTSSLKFADEPKAVLYLHGGAYYLCDPHSHRRLTSTLSHHAAQPVLVPRYRLAPQNPFPAALLDALISYILLLRPSPSSPGLLHPAIKPENITFVGDSAGGGLALSLLQLLHRLDRPDLLPVPGKLLVLSPWADLPRCFPSEQSCAHFDYLPPNPTPGRRTYRGSEAWPEPSPRGDMYAPTQELLTHPLVSPVLAESWPWRTKMYFLFGDECLRDSGLWLAWWAKRGGGDVVVRVISGMPHVFLGVVATHRGCRVEWDAVERWIRGEECDEWAKRVHPITEVQQILTEEEMTFGMGMADVKKMLEKAVAARNVSGSEEGEGVGVAVAAAAAKL